MNEKSLRLRRGWDIGTYVSLVLYARVIRVCTCPYSSFWVVGNKAVGTALEGEILRFGMMLAGAAAMIQRKAAYRALHNSGSFCLVPFRLLLYVIDFSACR